MKSNARLISSARLWLSAALLLTLVSACSGDEEEESSDAMMMVEPDARPPLRDAIVSGDPDAGGMGDPDAASGDPDASMMPDPDAGVGEDDAMVMAPDQGPPPQGFEALEWPDRECTLTLRYEGGGGEAYVAGPFTGWADSPRAMQRINGGFELAIDPSVEGMEPGSLHPYKLIVDGNWLLDPAETHRAYDGDCVNSAFKVPACDDGPAITAWPIELAADGQGTTATARFKLWQGGAALAAVEAEIDGEAVALTSDDVDGDTGEITLTLSGLEPGRHVLSIRAEDTMGRAAEPVDMPFWVGADGGADDFDWRDATLYMIVVDRFANGDQDIDDPVEGVQYPANWHGGDLWGVAEVIESGYFDDLGVDALWLSPINAQTSGAFVGRDDGNMYAAYHGYWPISGREVDPRFGGDAALDAVVEAAHSRGIRVLLDLINNQIHEEHEYFESNPDWFRTGCVCGIDPGCGWSERPLDCLFAPYLPDINWRNAGAEQQFIEDAVYWVERFGVDGYRVDAVKHVETNSIYNLRAALERRFEQGGERIVMLGETAVGEGDTFNDGCGVFYGSGYDWIEAYTGRNALDGQFDFPTHHRIQDGLLNGNLSFADLERSVAEMGARYQADALHVRFLGSHDKTRMASQAVSDPAVGCRWAGGGACANMPGRINDPEAFRRLKHAFTVLMTLPGIPLIYYGDEVAVPGGNDPDNRRDMPWDGPLASLIMQNVAPTPQQTDLRSWIAALGQARQQNTALTRGVRVPVRVDGDLYVYARRGEAAGEVALVIINRGPARNNMVIALQGASAGLARQVNRFEALVGEATVTPDADAIRLTIGAGEAAVLVAQ